MKHDPRFERGSIYEGFAAAWLRNMNWTVLQLPPGEDFGDMIAARGRLLPDALVRAQRRRIEVKETTYAVEGPEDWPFLADDGTPLMIVDRKDSWDKKKPRPDAVVWVRSDYRVLITLDLVGLPESELFAVDVHNRQRGATHLNVAVAVKHLRFWKVPDHLLPIVPRPIGTPRVTAQRVQVPAGVRP